MTYTLIIKEFSPQTNFNNKMNPPQGQEGYPQFNFTEEDYRDFLKFWKEYNVNIGQKTVRKAKGLITREKTHNSRQ